MSTLRASFELPPTPAAPRTARVVLGELNAWTVDDGLVEDAGMLVHEVVANVVDHAGSASRGRGMQIVASLAHRWGSEERDGGKRDWFDLQRSLDRCD